MNKPNATMIPPATRWPVVDRIQFLRLPAVAPRTVKTRANPRLNSRMGIRGRSSSRWAPETKERYPGTRGYTHGEAKEITPAAKARPGAHQADRPCSTRSAIMRDLSIDPSCGFVLH